MNQAPLNQVTGWSVAVTPDGVKLTLARKHGRDAYLLTPEMLRSLADALQGMLPEDAK